MTKQAKSTKTLTIGSLCLNIKSIDLAPNLMDCAAAVDFEVSVEYTYQPGLPNQTHGAFADAEEGFDEEVEILAVKATAATHFEGSGWSVTAARGTDLKDLFSSREIGELEDRILKMVEADRDE